MPGEVFPAEPGGVEAARRAAGRVAGWLARPGDEGAPDRAAGPGQRVTPQHLAQVVQGDAQVCRDLGGRRVLVHRAWWMGAGSVRAGSAPGQAVAVAQSSGGCQCRGSSPIPQPSRRRRAWPASAVAGWRACQGRSRCSCRRFRAEPVRRRGGAQAAAGEQLVKVAAGAGGRGRPHPGLAGDPRPRRRRRSGCRWRPGRGGAGSRRGRRASSIANASSASIARASAELAHVIAATCRRSGPLTIAMTWFSGIPLCGSSSAISAEGGNFRGGRRWRGR